MKKKEIVINGKVVEVNDEFYKEYMRLENNEKYINRKEQKKGLFYYNSLDTEEMLGEEIISNPNEISVFDEVMKNIEIESLKKAIETLNKKERIIIDLLFFKFLNEIEVAKILKMSNQNVNYLKKKILKKII
ncbi:hypothetical protein [uncultured Tyzzerella sp.]|uniref:hypothetical protein n=1 Tax=uncultured Tyzzerella sp. TaxID=2321398 RepID=UPI002941E4F3|nr:hypothetical protein [uncultured Tyzzerella sp.]